VNDRSRPKAAPETAGWQSESSLTATITADGITKLLSSRCVDCNGPTVGDAQSILDGFCLFLTRHAATCPWSKRAHHHGIGNGDVLVHPLGHLAGDEEVLVFLADVGDEVCRGR
jgi:hypothetical protein